MNKEIMVWKCPDCKDIILSTNWTSHDMNFCKCRNTGCDFEEHLTRWATNSLSRVKIKQYKLKDLLK